MKRTLFLFVVVAACGGSEKKSTTPTGGEEHAALTPELTAFHDVLAPRWHATAGEQRMKDTCGALADFETRAAAIKAAPATAGADPAAWTDAGAALETALGGLKSACAGTDIAGFDAAFTAVHEAFHHAMGLVVGEHEMGEHGEHH